MGLLVVGLVLMMICWVVLDITKELEPSSKKSSLVSSCSGDIPWTGDVDKLLKAREDGTIKSIIIPRIPGGRGMIFNFVAQTEHDIELLRMEAWDADNSCDKIEYIGRDELRVTPTNGQWVFPNS